MKSHFAPAPLLPPTLTVGFKEYVEYVSAYKVYCDHLSGLRAGWKKTVNERASKVKEASTRSCDLKVSYDVEVKAVERFLPSGVVKIPAPMPVVRYTEVPRVPSEVKPLSADEKKARLKAKRHRHRKNVALRKAEYEAKLSSVKAKASKNRAKMASFEKSVKVAGKTTGKAGVAKPAGGSGRKSRSGKDTSARTTELEGLVTPNPAKLSIPDEFLGEVELGQSILPKKSKKNGKKK